MAIIEGKKLIIVGDRDGVPGPAIEECAKSAGADEILLYGVLCLNQRRCNGPRKPETCTRVNRG